MKTVIKTHDLSKTYTGAVPVHALKNVSIEFRQGEFTAIVGPSGSGKTTFLNVIGGLDKPTGGHVIINGVDIALPDIEALFLMPSLNYSLARDLDLEFVGSSWGEREPFWTRQARVFSLPFNIHSD
jgi:ABC-type oligopeptide transport system ATPase subunit